MRLIKIIFGFIAPLLVLCMGTGCTEDPVGSQGAKYGFVQFKLMKNGSIAPAAASLNAGTPDRLDSLSDAKKIRVTLKSSDVVIEQTLNLSAADNTQTERGLWSDKLQLLPGSYRITGYELLDNLDRTILTGDEDISFEVAPGGLAVQSLGVNVRPRGLVRFELVKDFSQITTRAVDCYRFENIAKADIAVEHELTGELTRLKGVRTKVEYFYEDDQTATTHSKVVCDTIAAFKAGAYRVISFVVYNKNKEILEATTKLAENTFVVADNQTTVAGVPVTLQPSAGHIRDGIVLKKIWEALDGSNWSYRGKIYPKGCNWSFDRDIDLWTAQPGVKTLDNGRVATIALGGFGAKGDMPEALGELDELRNLILGSHNDGFGDSPINDVDPESMAEALRKEFKELSAPDCSLMAMAPEMRPGFPEQMQARIKSSENRGNRTAKGLNAFANNPNNFASAIRSLPASIGKLKKLRTLFVSNCPISELPQELSQLDGCTDVEIYNCPNLTRIPNGLMQMPKLQMLYFVNNNGILAGPLYEDLQKMCESASAKSIQGIYFMNNNLARVPDLRKMERLSFLDMQNNRIEEFDAPFGKDHNLGTLNMSNNKLRALPRDEQGYFAGFEAVEAWSFAGNQFTELPDIFDAGSPFLMGTVDFSQNKITTIEHAAEGTYKGVNVEIFNLSFNRLPKFPKCIYNSGSKINFLMLRGNGMTEFEQDALKGEFTFITMSLDLASNRLRKLPAEFNNITFGYMVGLDMSNNAFDAFPTQALNLANLSIFILRGQRNDEGYRCMREWPVGIYRHHGLNTLYLGSNDIRKVFDGTLDKIRMAIELTDNPNLSIDLGPLCPYLMSRQASILVDAGQDVRGCDAVVPKN